MHLPVLPWHNALSGLTFRGSELETFSWISAGFRKIVAEALHLLERSGGENDNGPPKAGRFRAMQKTKALGNSLRFRSRRKATPCRKEGSRNAAAFIST